MATVLLGLEYSERRIISELKKQNIKVTKGFINRVKNPLRNRPSNKYITENKTIEEIELTIIDKT